MSKRIGVTEDERASINPLLPLGAILYLVIVARIVWHFIDRQPQKLSDHPAFNKAARAVQFAMLVLVAAQLLAGPIDVWSGGWPIDVFGWFALPSPLREPFKAWHNPVGDIHRYSGYLIGMLVAVHIAAAFKHLWVNRDGTVQLMLELRLPSAPVRAA